MYPYLENVNKMDYLVNLVTNVLLILNQISRKHCKSLWN